MFNVVLREVFLIALPIGIPHIFYAFTNFVYLCITTTQQVLLFTTVLPIFHSRMKVSQKRAPFPSPQFFYSISGAWKNDRHLEDIK